jgi:hypothetical protein
MVEEVFQSILDTLSFPRRALAHPAPDQRDDEEQGCEKK